MSYCVFKIYRLSISVHMVNEINYMAFAFELKANLFTVACLWFLFQNSKCIMKV